MDEENNFTIKISEKNNIEYEKVNGGDEYLFSNLDLQRKIEDIRKWNDYDKIKALSNLINSTKQKKN